MCVVLFYAVTTRYHAIFNSQLTNTKHAKDSQKMDGLDQRHEGSRIKNIINVIVIVKYT